MQINRTAIISVILLTGLFRAEANGAPSGARLSDIGTYVTNLDRTAKFYHDVFGFEEDRRWETMRVRSEGGEWQDASLAGMFLVDSMGTRFEFLERGNPENRSVSQEPINHFAIEVEDVRRTLDRALAAGATMAFPGPRIRYVEIGDDLSVEHTQILGLDGERIQILKELGRSETRFEHDVTTEMKPWNHERFDNAEDKFTFAIFSDLTGGEREGIFSVAVTQLNLLRPEFIVNVGDLIEGDSNDSDELHRQWDHFDDRADRAIAPVFYAGGNHDLTGLPLRNIWKERLEPTYYHFIYKDVLFLVLDTEDVTPERMVEMEQIRAAGVEVYKEQGPEAFKNTDYATLPERVSGRIGVVQADYFLKVIKRHPEARWTFVLSHKPAWQRENEERFSKIESALSDRPYTVFYGHTHIYQYEQRFGRDYINLATTGGQFFPKNGQSMDHIMLVTMDTTGATLVNLKLGGILDKKGKVPMNGHELEFEPKASE